jgi:hypothetical protein
MRARSALVWLAAVGSTGAGDGSFFVPSGTLDLCLSFEQSEAFLRAAAARYPSVTRLLVAGKSLQKNAMSVLCVGKACVLDDASLAARTPGAFLNAMHHSRECLSMMALHYGLQAVLAGYERGDAWALHLVSSRRMLFWPIVNPDGYLWNEINKPQGDGMQRKNRRPGCKHGRADDVGVDLNRNYPTCFEQVDDGASSDPCGEDYKGPAPFSELETQAVRALVERSNFSVALNIHSYGRLMLLPYSCKPLGHPAVADDAFYLRLARELAAANNFTVGRSWEPEVGLYTVDGDAADWMYHEHHIFALSPEVGGPGFWPTRNNPDEAVHLSVENVPMLLHAAWASGPLLRLERASLQWVKLDGTEGEQDDNLTISVDLVNAGLRGSQGEATLLVRAGTDGPQPNASSSDVLRAQSAGVLPGQYGSATLQVQVRFSDAWDGITLAATDLGSCVVYRIGALDVRRAAGKPDALLVDLNNTVYTERHDSCWTGETRPPSPPPTEMPDMEMGNDMGQGAALRVAAAVGAAALLVPLLLGGLCWVDRKRRSRYAEVDRLELTRMRSASSGDNARIAHAGDLDFAEEEDEDQQGLSPMQVQVI